MRKPTPLVFWLLAAGVTSASAMSLGPSPDSASVGRALDLRFPLLGDPREFGSSLCLSVDVRYGEDRVSDSTAILEETGGDTRFVRVRTSSPVNEPIVSVRLQAGCDQPFTRNYTLLAGAPIQAGLSPSLPTLGRASNPSMPIGQAPGSDPAPAERAARRQILPSATRPTPSARSSETSSSAAPARPRTSAATPRAESGAGGNPRKAQGSVASNVAPSPSGAKPILQLEDPAYFKTTPDAQRPADAAAVRPPAAGGEPSLAAPDTTTAGASPVAGPPPVAPAAAQEDQVALMRAELAAARKEIARLQADFAAKNRPAPEDDSDRTYLIAAIGAALAAAGLGAWALRRNRKRKAEAGAWWHGSHSVQAPGPSGAMPGATATGHSEMSSIASNELAYPVSMLPEDLERNSMFPEFLRNDARPTLTPHNDAGVTLPGASDEDARRHQGPASILDDKAVRSMAAEPASASSMQAAAAAPSALSTAPLPSVAAPPPTVEAPDEPSTPEARKPSYRDLDLDLDLDAEPDPRPLSVASAPAMAPAVSAASKPARLDEGNLIDFESAELGGFLKPASREHRD